MKIFVRGLPADTSPRALQSFAETLLAPPWYLPFRKRIKIKRCVVLKMKDLDLGTVEFHGLLEVSPYKSAVEAVELLNNRQFHGRLLEARKWHERSDLADRRQRLYSADRPSDDERRRHDRRRARLVVDSYEPPRFQGLRQFHRELGR